MESNSLLALRWLRSIYSQVWAVDTEYRQTPEGLPHVVCIVMREVFGRLPALYLFEHEFQKECPVDFNRSDVLFASYAAPAELGSFLQIGWPVPRNILDLWAEARMNANYIGQRSRVNLLATLAHYGIDSMDYVEKEEMRALIMGKTSYTPEEQKQILEYCDKDVLAILELLPFMLPEIPGLVDAIKTGDRKTGWVQALFRGRYQVAITHIDREGVPIDVKMHDRIMTVRPQIRQRLIDETNAKYDVYTGDTFTLAKFTAYLNRQGIWWPQTRTGLPKTDEATFEMMRDSHPELDDLYHARKSIKELNASTLTIFADGRSRAFLNPFASNTGRNQPSKYGDKGRFIFGFSKWFRSLIQAKPGEALAYIDYVAQEVCVAAGRSRDPNMIATYNSGSDVYIEFAKTMGLVPEDATKKSHPDERAKCKICFLAVLYGRGAKSVARALKIPLVEAEDILAHHHDYYPTYWKWTEEATIFAPQRGRIFTPAGWMMKIDTSMEGQKKSSGKIHSNYRTLLNWPIQSTGGDMLRCDWRVVWRARPACGLPARCMMRFSWFLQSTESRRTPRSSATSWLKPATSRWAELSPVAPMRKSCAIPTGMWTMTVRRCGTKSWDGCGSTKIYEY
jgi:DNA polymerase I